MHENNLKKPIETPLTLLCPILLLPSNFSCPSRSVPRPCHLCYLTSCGLLERERCVRPLGNSCQNKREGSGYFFFPSPSHSTGSEDFDVASQQIMSIETETPQYLRPPPPPSARKPGSGGRRDREETGVIQEQDIHMETLQLRKSHFRMKLG